MEGGGGEVMGRKGVQGVVEGVVPKEGEGVIVKVEGSRGGTGCRREEVYRYLNKMLRG